MAPRVIGEHNHNQLSLNHSISESALAGVSAAAPGGAWQYRPGGKQPPPPEKHDPTLTMNMSQAVAFKAARKPTLHGIVGTGNRISSVIQYPVQTRDPLNLCQSRARHLSAEDRRILRVQVKHHLRSQRGSQTYNDTVHLVEKELLKNFAQSDHMCQTFFQNEDYAAKLLGRVATTIILAQKGKLPAPAEPSAAQDVHLIPHGHGAFCGPNCYCLKYQDAALKVQGDTTTKTDRRIWEDSFHRKALSAGDRMVSSMGDLAKAHLMPPTPLP